MLFICSYLEDSVRIVRAIAESAYTPKLAASVRPSEELTDLTMGVAEGLVEKPAIAAALERLTRGSCGRTWVRTPVSRGGGHF